MAHDLYFTVMVAMTVSHSYEDSVLNCHGRYVRGRDCLGGHLMRGAGWRIIPLDVSTKRGSEMMSVFQMAPNVVMCLLVAVCVWCSIHTLYCLNTSFGNHSPYGVYPWVSLCILWRLIRYSHHTEPDWDLIKICPRMHGSIIADLMRAWTCYSHAYTIL